MRIIAVSSGKGGVGKTTLSCNLGLAIAEQNKKVLMVDGDLGLANVDIHFGVRPIHHLGDVLKGKSIKECITPLLKNIDLIAGGSGLVELTHLNAFQRREIINQVQDLQFSYDFAIIDTASGIYEHVLHLNSVADECIIVLTQDPSSFADAYAMIKVLNQKYKMQNFKIVCNQMKAIRGEQLFIKFSEVVERFLSVRLSLVGSLPYDENLKTAQQQQRSIMRQSSDSETAKIFRQIAVEILADSQSAPMHNLLDSTGQKTRGLEAIFRPATGHA
jgi:flagellar biosynthesis protein FlhG